MDIWKKKKSPFDYEIDENGIDSYGVDHNKFSLRDELGYQYDRSEYENKMLDGQNPIKQVLGATGDMITEYFKMKNHGYQGLDDYHHCKANYNAASRGPYGYNTAKYLGDKKEEFDYYKNRVYKGLSEEDAQKDKIHDLGINSIGRLKGDSGLYDNAQDACAKYRLKNPKFPKKYW